MQLFSAKHKKVDKKLLYGFYTIMIVAVLAFVSAALSLSGYGKSSFNKVIFVQFITYILGATLAYFISKINYKIFRIFSLIFFIVTVILSLFVFIPGLGVSKGEATRWINIFGFSLQPSEFLKISSVLLVSHLYAKYNRYIKKDIKYSLGILGIVAFVVSVVLYLQSDNGTLVTILASIGIIAFVSGINYRHIFIAFLVFIFTFSVVLYTKPYAMERVLTYIGISDDPLAEAYHTKQAKIAIGSGQVLGRGFGESIQKFKFLPEPTSDSIFAVYSEEFGFIGAVFLIGLYMFLIFRILYLAKKIFDKKRDLFAFNTLVGIASIIFIQFTLNVGSMLDIIPLTGLPLPFVSKGGSSILALFIAMGIVFSISRDLYSRKRKIF